ncbi:MAG: glycyl-radical enzyme activating protein [Bacteroidales bacterium]|nr:glycyl-radical enzyme activating protein [Bacteroidales bacterium]
MLVFDIKRYAIHDGPGIRITIFMKGCPLSCVWCHNPEGISSKKQKLYNKKKCIGCRACIAACPEHAITLTTEGIVTDSSRCTACGECARVCPTLACEISGSEYTTEALMQEIEKERIFIEQSGGGVTICGGEPLLHLEPLLDLLKQCGKAGIHRAVDTTLFAKPDIVKEVMDNCELFLIDLKNMDSEKHRQFCGVPNEMILSNIKMVAEAGHDYIIRIPMIEGFNADEENVTRSAEFLASLPKAPIKVELLPYHDIAKGKHEKLGTVYNPHGYAFAAPDIEKFHALTKRDFGKSILSYNAPESGQPKP